MAFSKVGHGGLRKPSEGGVFKKKNEEIGMEMREIATREEGAGTRKKGHKGIEKGGTIPGRRIEGTRFRFRDTRSIHKS